MSNIPEDLRYTPDHEWLALDGDLGRVGITDHAQHELGDVVFVELPATGSTLRKGDAFGVVESVKAVSDLYAPVSGTVVEVNESLEDEPEKVNRDPYGEGWMIAIELSDASEVDQLLDAAAYAEHAGD